MRVETFKSRGVQGGIAKIPNEKFFSLDDNLFIP